MVIYPPSLPSRIWHRGLMEWINSGNIHLYTEHSSGAVDSGEETFMCQDSLELGDTANTYHEIGHNNISNGIYHNIACFLVIQ